VIIDCKDESVDACSEGQVQADMATSSSWGCFSALQAVPYQPSCLKSIKDICYKIFGTLHGIQNLDYGLMLGSRHSTTTLHDFVI
jgi:hypothetical protein